MKVSSICLSPRSHSLPALSLLLHLCLIGLFFTSFLTPTPTFAAPLVSPPTISRVSGCVDWYNTTRYCPTQRWSRFVNLTVIGDGFTPNVDSIMLGEQFPCEPVHYHSPSRLLCLLPAVSEQQQWALPLNLTVHFDDPTIFASIDAAVTYYDGGFQPTVYDVSGCTSTALAGGDASGCRAGDVVTVTGNQFPVWMSNSIAMVIDDAAQITNCSLSMDEAAVVICTLSDIVSSFTAGIPYNFDLCFNWRGSKYGATCSYLQYGPGITFAATPSSGSMPSIYRLSGCSDYGNTTQYCPSGMSTVLNLTIYGNHLTSYPIQSIYVGNNPNTLCTPIRLITPTRIICGLPLYTGSPPLDRIAGINVLYTPDLTITLRYAIQWSQKYMPPTINDVSGCPVKKGVTTGGCEVGMVITLSGSFFARYAYPVVYVYGNQSSWVTFSGVMNDEPGQLVCTLPPQVSQLPVDTLLDVVLSYGTSRVSSRFEAISFASSSLPSSSSAAPFPSSGSFPSQSAATSSVALPTAASSIAFMTSSSPDSSTASGSSDVSESNGGVIAAVSVLVVAAVLFLVAIVGWRLYRRSVGTKNQNQHLLMENLGRTSNLL